MKTPNILLYSIPFAIGVIFIESLILYFKLGKQPDIKDSATSVILGIIKIITSLLTKSLTLGIYLFVYHNFRLFTIDSDSFLVWMSAFIAVDFSFYVYHLASHKIRWFWASHITHHSSKNFNLFIGIRLNWTAALTGATLFYLWMPILGFNPYIIFIALQINNIYQYYVHTELITKMWRPVEYFFVTPSHHRVHHGSDIKYLDSNYGGVLIIWDRIFGTFVEENDKPNYGLVKQEITHNPMRLIFCEWIEIARDIRKARSFKEVFMFLFAPPGWSLDGRTKTTKQLKKEVI